MATRLRFIAGKGIRIMRFARPRWCWKKLPGFDQPTTHGNVRVNVANLHAAFGECRVIDPLQGAAGHEADLFVAQHPGTGELRADQQARQPGPVFTLPHDHRAIVRHG
jgi:hypothetical protein